MAQAPIASRSTLERWGDDLQRSHSNATVARPIVRAWGRDVMWDCLHLNAAGVEKFTPTISADVQSVLK
jgi:hypothetical protein